MERREVFTWIASVVLAMFPFLRKPKANPFDALAKGGLGVLRDGTRLTVPSGTKITMDREDLVAELSAEFHGPVAGRSWERWSDADDDWATYIPYSLQPRSEST